MRKKPGLTLQRHREIGAELKAIRDKLAPLAVEIGNAYPVTSKPSQAGYKALAWVEELRSLLDCAAFVEHPGPAGVGVYYPRTQAAEHEPPWWAR